MQCSEHVCCVPCFKPPMCEPVLGAYRRQSRIGRLTLLPHRDLLLPQCPCPRQSHYADARTAQSYHCSHQLVIYGGSCRIAFLTKVSRSNLGMTSHVHNPTTLRGGLLSTNLPTHSLYVSFSFCTGLHFISFY